MLVEMVRRRGRATRGRCHATASWTAGNGALHPLFHPAHNTRLHVEWLELTDAFKGFSEARRQYHKAQKRRHRAAIREACRQSPIGQRVDGAGLFDTLLTEKRLGPAAMAARVMHRELEQSLKAREQHAKTKAANALSPTKEFWLVVMARAADDCRLRLGTWRTFLDRVAVLPLP